MSGILIVRWMKGGLIWMPLTRRGRRLLKKLQQEYGTEKGKRVFYAMEQEGKVKGVTEKKDK